MSKFHAKIYAEIIGSKPIQTERQTKLHQELMHINHLEADVAASGANIEKAMSEVLRFTLALCS